jgi:inner membrane transporter RhtA
MAGEQRVDGLQALLPYAAVIAATSAFQGGAALAKSLFPVWGSQGTATVRLFLGALMLLAVTRPWRRWPAQAPLAPLIGLGLATAGAVFFFYMALERLPQGVAIALQFLGPLGVAVASSRRASDVVWAVLAAAGVWGLVGHDLGPDAAHAIDPLGVVWALCAAGSWAAYIVVGQAAGRAFGAATAPLAIAVAALVVLPLGVPQAGVDLLRFDLLPIALLVALISTAIPFTLEMYALNRMPARTFAVLTSIEPMFGAVFGFVVLHEILAAGQLAGVAAVIAAAAGAAWTARPREPLPAPD